MSLLCPRMTERPPNFRLNPASPLAQGLVFFGGGLVPGGSRMYDGSVYGNHGTLINMDPQTDWAWVPELRRWGLDFHETSQQIVNCGNGIPRLAPPLPLTISCWIYPYPEITSATGVVTLNQGAVYYGAQISLAGYANGRYPIGYSYGDGSGANQFARRTAQTQAYLLYEKTWAHIAGRACGPTDIQVFHEGLSVPVTYSGEGGNIAWNPSCDTTIGQTWANVERYFDGKLADVCVWARALSASEIAALADPGNVDLRVGGVPLILPPRRRIFPAAVAEVAGIPRHFMHYQRMSSNVA